MTENNQRQTHLWERGRKPPDLSPYEAKLKKKLNPLIRKDTEETPR